MANVLDISAKEFKAAPQKVAYHSPCHLCRGLQVIEEPRKLIEIAGYEYVPSKDEDVCCGFGGSYSVAHMLLTHILYSLMMCKNS